MNNAHVMKVIVNEFEEFMSIKCQSTLMIKGQAHNPSRLSKEQQGVYAFVTDTGCIKVGKAGPNSQARWNSHHYNVDEKSSSTMTKSMIKYKEMVKAIYPVNKHAEIDDLNDNNIGNWIKSNTSRMEFIISAKESKFVLNFLEAIVQLKLQPIFEGRVYPPKITSNKK